MQIFGGRGHGGSWGPVETTGLTGLEPFEDGDMTETFVTMSKVSYESENIGTEFW